MGLTGSDLDGFFATTALSCYWNDRTWREGKQKFERRVLDRGLDLKGTSLLPESKTKVKTIADPSLQDRLSIAEPFPSIVGTETSSRDLLPPELQDRTLQDRTPALLAPSRKWSSETLAHLIRSSRHVAMWLLSVLKAPSLQVPLDASEQDMMLNRELSHYKVQTYGHPTAEERIEAVELFLTVEWGHLDHWELFISRVVEYLRTGKSYCVGATSAAQQLLRPLLRCTFTWLVFGAGPHDKVRGYHTRHAVRMLLEGIDGVVFPPMAKYYQQVWIHGKLQCVSALPTGYTGADNNAVVAGFSQLVRLTSPTELLEVLTALRISGEALEAVLCLRSSTWTDEDLAARVRACASYAGQQMSALLAVLVALPDLLPHHFNNRAQELEAEELLLGQCSHLVLSNCPLVRTARHIMNGGKGKHPSANAEMHQAALHTLLQSVVKNAQRDVEHGPNRLRAAEKRGSKMVSWPSANLRACA